MRYLLLLAFLVIFSGPPAVYFSEPQPQGLEPDSRFEAAFQGNYYSRSDSSMLIIGSNCIYKERTMTVVAYKPEMTTLNVVTAREGKRYFKHHPIPIEVLYENDSLLTGNLIIRDTLFKPGPGQVLNYYRGYQILNNQVGDKQWEVGLLGIDGYGHLNLYQSFLPKDLWKLETITPIYEFTSSGLTTYQLRPDRAAFGKLLKPGLLFKEVETFEKLGRQVIYN